MTTDAHEQLIQEVLGGGATPAQTSELERLIAADPVARTRYEEMRQLFRMLADAPNSSPPADLHAGIMQGIAAAAPLPRPVRRRGFLKPVIGGFLVGAAAASLVVVTIVRGLDGFAGARTSGTMAPLGAQGAGIISETSFMTTGGMVSVVSTRDGDHLRVVIRSRVTRPIDLEAQYDPARFELTGWGWVPALKREITRLPGRILLPGTTADQVQLNFTAIGSDNSPIRVTAPGSMAHTKPGPGVD